MYVNLFSRRRRALLYSLASFTASSLVALGMLHAAPVLPISPMVTDPNSVIRKISGLSDKLELTTNSSRILTLDKNIPRVQVNNPELLAVTPLSATQVQISAKKAGVTQVNLWDEDGAIHTVDIQIYGDARELQVALQTQFPHASIKVYRYSESLVLTGFVDRPDHISPIMALAQDYAPKVINNINVGGVQQVLLKVKVMEVSRTKLRRLSTDWTFLDANGSFLSLGVGGLLNQTSNATGGFQSVIDTAGKSAEFGIVGDDAAFFGFLDWVQQNQLAKILAEPNIVAVSGRPAQFNVGGEIPIVVPQSLGTASIEFKPFGTQVDFLPIVLGNGKIRLEVRPRISEIDDSRSVVVQDFVIPALTVRQVDTAVEMQAGQTFAIAGLVQERTETIKRGIPYLSDVPVIGFPFRKSEDDVNEIELLILVTPEFVDAVDKCEMPCGGPGTFTTSPTNRGLYCAGQVEVPTYANPTQGLTSCGGGDECCNGGCGNAGCNRGGCSNCNGGPADGRPTPMMHESVMLPGGSGYDDESGGPTVGTSITDQTGNGAANLPEPKSIEAPVKIPSPEKAPADQKQLAPPQRGTQSLPDDIMLPLASDSAAAGTSTAPAEATIPMSGSTSGIQARTPGTIPPSIGQGAPTYTAPRPYSPQRQPVFMRNASRPYNPQSTKPQSAGTQGSGGLIGPIGYDSE